MFSDRDLKKLIFPLIVEQLLAITIGIVDTIMVASCGESAVSGISLVDSICILLIGLFSALASGGSVVAAQFIGQKDRKNVAKASNQLFSSIFLFSIIFMVLALVFNYELIHLIYGNIEADVMSNARIYFYITAISFPFLAIYNAGAALFRAVGNSKVSMQVAFVANIANAIGNAVLIYVFHLGVTGAAISTLASRILSALVICYLLTKTDDVPIEKKLYFDWPIMKRILYIGIPNGLENSIFQIGKLIVSSFIASYGTAAITANAVSGNISGFQLIPTNAIGIAMITVVGQAVGANKIKEAKQYTKKLITLAYIFISILGVIMFLFADQICSLYHLSPETQKTAVLIIRYSCICCMLVHPLAFALSNALRAANDVTFTMLVSILSMWACRIGLAYLLGTYFSLGVFGVWIAMTIDWAIRAFFFTTRITSGRWEKHMHFSS